METFDAKFHGGGYGVKRVEVFRWAGWDEGYVFFDHCYEFIAVGVGEF